MINLIEINSKLYKYKIIYKNNKNIYVRLKDEIFIVTTPKGIRINEIEKILANLIPKLLKKNPKKIEYVKDNQVLILGEFKEKCENLDEQLKTELFDYLKENYIKIIKKLDIEKVPSIKLIKVKSYVGQYNRITNTIKLNYLLGHLRGELIDYVIIHELAHIKVANHSSKFWYQVEKFCYNYKELRKELRKSFKYYD